MVVVVVVYCGQMAGWMKKTWAENLGALPHLLGREELSPHVTQELSIKLLARSVSIAFFQFKYACNVCFAGKLPMLFVQLWMQWYMLSIGGYMLFHCIIF